MTDNASDQQSQCDQRPAGHSPTRPAAFVCSPVEVEHLVRLRIFCEVAHSNLRSRADNDNSADCGRRHAFRVVALLACHLGGLLLPSRPTGPHGPRSRNLMTLLKPATPSQKHPRRPALWKLCDAGDGCCDPGESLLPVRSIPDGVRTDR